MNRKTWVSGVGVGASAVKSRRIAAPIGVPSGSRVRMTSSPRARSDSASLRHWVDLPEPSTPSTVMSMPRMLIILPLLHQEVVPAIPRPAALRFLGAERALLAVGDEGDAARRPPARHEIAHGRLGPALAQRQVVLVRSPLVTMTLDQEELLRIRLEPARARVQDLDIPPPDDRLVEVEVHVRERRVRHVL